MTEGGGLVGVHGGYGEHSAPRNKMRWDMRRDHHGSIDVEFAKMVLRFPGTPPPHNASRSLPAGSRSTSPVPPCCYTPPDPWAAFETPSADEIHATPRDY